MLTALTHSDKIPAHTMEALKKYAEERIPVGGFLTAVLSNDLRGAVLQADPENREALNDIVGFIYNEMPGKYWGSSERVQNFLNGLDSN